MGGFPGVRDPLNKFVRVWVRPACDSTSISSHRWHTYFTPSRPYSYCSFICLTISKVTFGLLLALALSSPLIKSKCTRVCWEWLLVVATDKNGTPTWVPTFTFRLVRGYLSECPQRSVQRSAQPYGYLLGPQSGPLLSDGLALAAT